MEINDIISSGLLELYATGIASPEEAIQVEQWAAQYPEVAAELAAIQSSMEAYAKINAIQPDASVKEKLFAKINTTHPSVTATQTTTTNTGAKIIGIPSYWRMLAAASVILLFGSVAVNILLVNKNKGLDHNLKEAQQLAANMQKDNLEMKEDMHVVQDKYSMPVALKPMPGMDAAAKVFWMVNSGEVYIDPSNLPAAPAGKHYQFWGIVDGKPVSGGMITTNGKYRIQKMKSFGRVEAFAVSLEDKMDGTEPKGPIYVMGKM